MRRSILAIIMVLCGLTAQAQEVLAPNSDIEATIQGQFDAFAAEDLNGAWAFASPNIQRLFETPETFGRMVQEGYPMVWDPAQVDFIDLQTLSGIFVQRVRVTDRAGATHYLGYQMVQTDAGWQINAVMVLPAPDVGV